MDRVRYRRKGRERMGGWSDAFVCVSVIYLCMFSIHVCALMYICVYLFLPVCLLASAVFVQIHLGPRLYNVNQVILHIVQAHVRTCMYSCMHICMFMHHVSLAMSLYVISVSSVRLQSSLILCRSAAASVASSWRVEASDCSLLGVVS